ncbi:hypothetical protein TNCV_2313401 [Trichonephila clavipes]|nr:hypothetical protein TNCV_2313401 [Trichonephila clavipes]
MTSSPPKPFYIYCKEVLGPVDRRDVIYTATRLRTPSADQSSRRPSHHTTCPSRANCLIGHYPDTSSTFTTDPCVFLNHLKAPGGGTFGIVARITCAANDTYPLTTSFGEVSRMARLNCNGMEPGHLQRRI